MKDECAAWTPSTPAESGVPVRTTLYSSKWSRSSIRSCPSTCQLIPPSRESLSPIVWKALTEETLTTHYCLQIDSLISTKLRAPLRRSAHCPELQLLDARSALSQPRFQRVCGRLSPLSIRNSVHSRLSVQTTTPSISVRRWSGPVCRTLLM